MRYYVLPVLSLVAASLSASAATIVKVEPAHPTTCAQANEINVMTLLNAAVNEDEEDLYVFTELVYQSCARGVKNALVAPESEDRFAVLMKDGWRYPWNYKAPGEVSVLKSLPGGDPYVSVAIHLKKSEIFAESNRREFELVLTPVRNKDGYSWFVTLKKGATPSEPTQVMIRPNL